MADSKTTDRMAEIHKVSAQIGNLDAEIKNREAAISALRKERSMLVAKRTRLQKAEGIW